MSGQLSNDSAASATEGARQRMEENWACFEAEVDCAEAAPDEAEQTAEIAGANEDFFLSEDVPEQEQQLGICEPQLTESDKKMRGRPPGSFGSNFLRQQLKKKALQGKGESGSGAAAVPGTIEYARQFKKRKREDSPSGTCVESSCNTILSSGSSMWACVQDLGSPLQIALTTAAAYSMQKQANSSRETSDCAEVLRMKSSALMSDAAVKVALQKAGKQEIADVGRATLIGTSAAVLAGGALWSGALQAMWEKMHGPDAAWRGILLIQKLRHDETPLRIRLTEDGAVVQKGQEVAHHGKILQFEVSICALVEDVQSRKRMLLSGKIPAMLQTVDRMTTECLLAAIDRAQDVIPDWERFSAAFDNCFRVAASRPRQLSLPQPLFPIS